MPNEKSQEWVNWLSGTPAIRAVNGFTVEFVARYISGSGSLFDFDYDRALIFLALFVSGEFDLFLPGRPDPAIQYPGENALGSGRKPVSRLQISRITGLPRETTRRKFIELINKGYVLEDSRGGMVARFGLTTEHDVTHVRGLVLLLIRYYCDNLTGFVGGPALTAAFERQLCDPAYTPWINAITVQFVVRYMTGLAAHFNHDYNCAMIFLHLTEVGQHEIVRDPIYLEKYATLGASLPLALSKPISRMAIARGIGMTRETVRRKVAGLIENGFVQEHPDGGVCLRQGVTSEPALAGALVEAVDLLKDYFANLFDMPPLASLPEKRLAKRGALRV